MQNLSSEDNFVDNTIIFKEFSKETDVGDIPYYPKRLPGDKIILCKYENELKKLKNIIFSGRLATYRYMDMHQIIDDSLNISSNFLKNI